MYAIVEVQGKQYKVESGSKILVDKLGENETPEIKTLMIKKDDDSVLLGTPYLDDVNVSSKVLEEKKGEKVVIFKYKKRKDYQKKQGYRHQFHEIEIEDIKA